MPRIIDLPAAAVLTSTARMVIDDPGQTPATVRYEPGLLASVWGGNGLSFSVTFAQSEEYVTVSPPSFTLPETSALWTVEDGVMTCGAGAGGVYQVQANACMLKPSQEKEIRMRVALNAVTLPQTCSRTSVGGTPNQPRVASLATHTILTLEPGDALALAFGNWSDTGAVTLTNFQLTATRLR